MQYLFFLILFFTSCSNKLDYIDKAHLVIAKQTKMICKQEKLQVFGSGGAMLDGIKSIHLTFISYTKPDIAQARRMIIRSIERLKNAINSEESLKDHLMPYPFPVRGLDMSILFCNEKNDQFVEYGCVWLGTGGVSSVMQVCGKLCYSSYNPRTKLLEPYYEEPYEEALAIVNAEAGISGCEDCPELLTNPSNSNSSN